MNAPGKSLLKVVSILFIIFGAIGAVVSALALAASAAGSAIAGAAADAAGSDAATAVVAVVTGVVIIASVVGLIDSALTLVFGIIGVGKKSGDPGKGGFYVVTGVILCALALVSIILTMAFSTSGFPWSSLINFVLPILYIVGGSMNKKAVVMQ